MKIAAELGEAKKPIHEGYDVVIFHTDCGILRKPTSSVGRPERDESSLPGLFPDVAVDIPKDTSTTGADGQKTDCACDEERSLQIRLGHQFLAEFFAGSWVEDIE